ncbi:MAG: hypothetical protein ACD_79C00596G0001 [uncultured bacterium]|nr:MAG: hypothetical protein ACD_79C00596G0001 [uncultured bacterium]
MILVSAEAEKNTKNVALNKRIIKPMKSITNKKHSITHKIKRQITAFLPIHVTRTGTCKSCGSCCKLVFKCPWLKFDENGKSFCKIYSHRPLSCKKYPRTSSEFVTANICGFKFEETPSKKNDSSKRKTSSKSLK